MDDDGYPDDDDLAKVRDWSYTDIGGLMQFVKGCGGMERPTGMRQPTSGKSPRLVGPEMRA